MDLKNIFRHFVLFAIVLLAGCAAPSVYLQEEAERLAFRQIELPGKPFRHIAYTSHENVGDSLHVYIEGDGVPWVARFFVATDPTPSSSIVFDLMALDTQRNLYLGRPCYIVQSCTEYCNPRHWTHRRLVTFICIAWSIPGH